MSEQEQIATITPWLARAVTALCAAFAAVCGWGWRATARLARVEFRQKENHTVCIATHRKLDEQERDQWRKINDMNDSLSAVQTDVGYIRGVIETAISRNDKA